MSRVSRLNHPTSDIRLTHRERRETRDGRLLRAICENEFEELNCRKYISVSQSWLHFIFAPDGEFSSISNDLQGHNPISILVVATFSSWYSHKIISCGDATVNDILSRVMDGWKWSNRGNVLKHYKATLPLDGQMSSCPQQSWMMIQKQSTEISPRL